MKLIFELLSTYKNVLQNRPFLSRRDLLDKADLSWSKCTKTDALEAFTDHPKIGDLSGLEKKYASTAHWAQNEQKGVEEAAKGTLERLALGNKKYEDKFGYIFIVCASRKTAREMLELLENRLENNANDEMEIAMAEQHKITKLRLEKLLT